MRLMRTLRSADSLVRAFQTAARKLQAWTLFVRTALFREGSENCARGGCVPRSCFGLRVQPVIVDSRTRLSALRRRSAFTLVEIAISMAIIGFAVVAIIGVLPMGLNVQKENREETIINNEASFYMNAIRTGARGLDDLTNHVFAITNFWTRYDTSTYPWTFVARGVDGFTRLKVGLPPRHNQQFRRPCAGRRS